MPFRTTYIFFAAGIALLGAMIIVLGLNNDRDQKASEKSMLITLDNLEEIKPMPARDMYGFVKDEFSYEEYTVRQNESLYLILRRHDLSPRQIYELEEEAANVTNLNRMVPGQKYRIYYKDDEPVSFVWQPQPTQYVTASWNEGYNVGLGEIPVRTVTRESAGIIRNSLYETIVGQGNSPNLGSEMAAVFAWQVDFFALRPGDHYKVIYEERYAGDQFIGIGDIKAAEFQHRGAEHRAYFLNHEERRGYFDEEGNSLEKDLLKAPFRYSQRISSNFSKNRFHPILRENRPHYGTDYAAPTGTPVLAVGDGTVAEAQRRGGNGNIVQIEHNGTYKTAYLHLNGFAPGIRKGVQVEQGQVIGYVGQTGLATGPHLCYRLYKNEQPVNSVTADLPAAESLEEELMTDLRRVVSRYSGMLDELKLIERVADAEDSSGSSRNI